MGGCGSTKATENYEIDKRKLGQGRYGSVFKAKNRSTGHVHAIKKISKQGTKQKARFQQEIAITRMMDHPNIIKLHESLEDKKSVYLVMEMCFGGELHDRIIDESGHFTEVQAAISMEQMVCALRYMHANQVIHRDVKPQNFVFMTKDPIEQNVLKIIDFGVSRSFSVGQVLKTKVGTPLYMAPQVLAGKYDQMSDMWSIGVIMYFMLCGYHPFDGRDLSTKVRLGNFQFPASDWKNISQDAKNLIRNLLQMNPLRRHTAEQTLNHEWIKNGSPQSAPSSHAHRNPPSQPPPEVFPGQPSAAPGSSDPISGAAPNGARLVSHKSTNAFTAPPARQANSASLDAQLAGLGAAALDSSEDINDVEECMIKVIAPNELVFPGHWWEPMCTRTAPPSLQGKYFSDELFDENIWIYSLSAVEPMIWYWQRDAVDHADVPDDFNFFHTRGGNTPGFRKAATDSEPEVHRMYWIRKMQVDCFWLEEMMIHHNSFNDGDVFNHHPSAKICSSGMRPLRQGWELQSVTEFEKLPMTHLNRVSFAMMSKYAFQMNLQTTGMPCTGVYDVHRGLYTCCNLLAPACSEQDRRRNHQQGSHDNPHGSNRSDRTEEAAWPHRVLNNVDSSHSPDQVAPLAMQIFIRPVTGTSFVIELEACDTIQKVKADIYKRTCMPVKQLEDAYLASHNHIKKKKNALDTVLRLCVAWRTQSPISCESKAILEAQSIDLEC